MKDSLHTHSNHSIPLILTALLLLFTCSGLYGQLYLSGDTNVDLNDIRTYTLTPPSGSVTYADWSAGGEIRSSTNTNAIVKWDVQGTRSLSVFFQTTQSGGNFLFDGIFIQVTGPPPPTPGNPSISSNGCGQAVLARTGSPPTGVNWYWQGKNASGTSTTKGNGATFNVDEGTGTYYIRAYHNETAQWSTGSGSRYVSIANLTAGSISGTQTICYNGNPGTLSNSASAGGVSGSVAYQWQYSNNGTSGWTNISGATSTSYNPPGGLTADRWYRRRAICASQTRYTGSVKVTVRPTLSPGGINGAHTIVHSGNPNTLGSSSAASGGNGSYSYQWQFSNNGSSSWTNISGATATTYNPPAGLTADRWYRRRVSSCSETKYTNTVKVTVNPLFIPGSISGVQTIVYNGNPSALGNSAPASGGDGSHSYQWQYSNSGTGGWTNISGATTTSYDPPGGLTADRWYRRRAISFGETKYTNTVKVTVNPVFNAGSISGATTVCYGGNPAALSNSASASGGDGSYSYQWQRSTTSGTSGFSNISGATSTSYDPGALTATTWYRRRATSFGETSSSNSLQVTVNPALGAGSISGAQTICYSGDPGTLSNSASASGGDGSYAYQWQYSNNGTGGWTNISGATSTAYNPPAGLTTDRWYRRRVISCGETQYTGLVRITVHPSLSAGAINGAQTIVSGEDPGVLGNSASATGGNGSYAYQWQYSNDGSSGWTAISGATGTSYDPPGGLSADRWYRRQVSSCGQTLHTATVKITVTQLITFYQDRDGDGFGDPDRTVLALAPPEGYVSNSNDACPEFPGIGDGCGYMAIALSDHNRVHTRVYQKEMAEATGITGNSDVMENVQYYDGLGRPGQDVGIKASPTGKDRVTHRGYDDYGRQARECLPYEAASGGLGSYQGTAEADTDSYYIAHYPGEISSGTPNPYSEKEFEASPLNRVLRQSAPGQAWDTGSGNEIRLAYGANTHDPLDVTQPANDNIRRFRATTVRSGNTFTPTLVQDGYFDPGELHKTVTKDENHDGTTSKLHTTEEFTDKQGQVVLKRTYALVSSSETAHDTYYVYDDYGNLTYVLPPKVDTSDGVSAGELVELCYQYVYDYRNRLVEKQLPGKGREYIVYNVLDQPVMTQDSIQRVNREWLFTKYDALGRVAYTGLHVHPGVVSRETMQGYAADTVTYDPYVTRVSSSITIGGTPVYYSNAAIPQSVAAIYTVTYYDSYVDTDGLTVPSTVLGQSKATNTQGLPTVSKVRVLDPSAGPGQADWITTVTGYDSKGRAIYTAGKNDYLNTTDIVETELDFGGKVVQTRTTHTKGANPAIVTTDRFDYDHRARLVRQTQTIGARTEVVVENAYDELGQLIQKQIGGSASSPTGLQTVDYAYNVRGWLTQINDPANLGSDDLFAFGINYNTVSHSGTPIYNGNIAETEWKTANDNVLRWYRYSYDALNRITGAIDHTLDMDYRLHGVTYDKNGNIMGLSRRGQSNADATSFGWMDVLTYQYNAGNKLTKVEDAGPVYGFDNGANTATEYTYDANGNMTSDLNKGITSINYNHMNLPTNVSINSGSIQYIYDATGTKLKKTVGSSVTLYAGNYVYTGSEGNEQLQFFNHPEGYISPDGSGGYDYVYQYKDHLGNVRLSYTDANGNGTIDVTSDPMTTEIVEENNYYPFGLKHKGYNSDVSPLGNSVAQQWKYNGTELEESLGLNLYEMDLRQYDPAIARWTAVDPVTHHAMSTYTAFDNNPVFWSDPSGANSVQDLIAAMFVNSGSGQTTYTNNGDGTFSQTDRDENCCDDDNSKDDRSLLGSWISGKIKSWLGWWDSGEDEAEELAEVGMFEEANKITQTGKENKERNIEAFETLSNIIQAELLFAQVVSGGVSFAAMRSSAQVVNSRYAAVLLDDSATMFTYSTDEVLYTQYQNLSTAGSSVYNYGNEIGYLAHIIKPQSMTGPVLSFGKGAVDATYYTSLNFAATPAFYQMPSGITASLATSTAIFTPYAYFVQHTTSKKR